MAAAGSTVICIVTNNRPDQLRALLGSLEGSGAPADTTVLVVDSDPAGSAAGIAAAGDSFDLTYLHHPHPGVVAPRNAGIDWARRAGFEYLVFIDDDEVVADGWLGELQRVQHEYGADIVAGWVEAVIDGPAPRWTLDGEIYQRARRPTGTRIEKAGAGNLLLRLPSLATLLPHLFDPRYSFTGAEDTQFVLRASRAGAVVVWADDAVAHETLPAARLSRRWFLRRRFRIGNAWALIEMDVYPGWWMRLRRVAGGGRLVVRSAALALFDAVRLSPRLTKSCGGVAEGLGMVVGAAGLAYETYGVSRPRLRRWRRVA